MPARKRSARARGVLEGVLVLLLGGLLGSALAALIRLLLPEGPLVGLLSRTWTLGLERPASLDLKVMSLTFGATLEVGLLTAAGAAVAFWLFLRLR